MISRSYRELRHLQTFEERFEYLKLGGVVGADTFGFDRYLNQEFYRSKEWRDVRHDVIARDNGCDLGIDGFEIFDRVLVHHLNPLTAEKLEHSDADILDPDNLICVSHNTHNAIHYGDASLLPRALVERQPGDTAPWL